jgi:hypothetical protein
VLAHTFEKTGLPKLRIVGPKYGGPEKLNDARKINVALAGRGVRWGLYEG